MNKLRNFVTSVEMLILKKNANILKSLKNLKTLLGTTKTDEFVKKRKEKVNSKHRKGKKVFTFISLRRIRTDQFFWIISFYYTFFFSFELEGL